MQRRSTWTTTVLAFASLTTTPCSTRFGIAPYLLCLLGTASALGRLSCRTFGALSGGLHLDLVLVGFCLRFGLRFGVGRRCLGLLRACLLRLFGRDRLAGLCQSEVRSNSALTQHGHDAGDVAPHHADTRGVFQLAACPLKAQVELLLLQLGELVAELVGRSVGEYGDLGHGSIPTYAVSRATNLVAIGNLPAANRIDSSATSRGTPSTSKRIRPGLILQTQNSGAPLPDPMRTSAGFLDTGTSGKTRIQTRPARFMWRVMARRAASIWRAVRRSGSMALRPNWPKLSVAPLVATPLIRPL